MRSRTSYNRIVQQYDRLAKGYDRKWRVYIRQTLERALDALRLSGKERILDVGCGTGEFERMAIGRFPQLALVGLDVAPGMVAIARQKFGDKSQVDFLVAQAERLPFGQETFDVVVCANVLHHVQEPKLALEEGVRVLRAGGQIVLIDWCRDFWHCRLMHWWLRLVDRTYTKMYRLVDVSSVLDELGLTIAGADRFVARPFYGMMYLCAEKIVVAPT